MQLNRIRLYRPNTITTTGTGSGGGAVISDQAYSPTIWNGDTLQGASRNSIRDKIESMGYISGKVIYVDATYGNDSTAQKGNILKPFISLYTAAAFATSGDLIVVFRGTYTLNSFGLPLRDGVDYFLLDAQFVNYGFSYGLLLSFPYTVTCNIFGKATFTDYSTSGSWSLITPYLACNIEVDGMTFIGNKQFLGQLGAVAGNKFLKFKNCRLISNDNNLYYYAGGGFNDGSALFEDCYIKGNFLFNSENLHPSYDYKLKFLRCELEANSSNTNGDVSSLRYIDYYANSTLSKVFLDHCVLRSAYHNIEIGEGYGGIGSNKFLIIKDCYFYNGAGSGWVKNEHINTGFKLVNNWSTHAASGSVPVVNILTGTGIIVDSNLE